MSWIKFMYYACGDGTDKGRAQEIDEISTLLGIGYIGFTENLDERVMVFRPFSMGVELNGRGKGTGKNYQIGVRA